MSFIRIVAVPPGEAPLSVREAWVGLLLPLADDGLGQPRKQLTSGVISGPRNFFDRFIRLITGKLEPAEGYAVEAIAAVEVLSKDNPEAARWWMENARHILKPGRLLLFH
jgi:hypothetical protein